MTINEKRYNNIVKFINSINNNYKELFNEKELELLSKITIDNFEEYKSILENFSRIVWEYELSTDNYVVISWNKNKEKYTNDVTFATISKKDDIISFCNLGEGLTDSINGVICDIDYDAIISLCTHDGATLIKDEEDEYTVCKINGKYYSSYNLASKYVTPMQMVTEYKESNQKTKYNEILLDTSKIKGFTSFTEYKNYSR